MSPILAALLGSFVALQTPAPTAPEAGPGEKPEAPASAPRFFETPIDFWGTGPAVGRKGEVARRSKAPNGPSPSAASDWGSLVRMPDGSLAYRELPAPLVRVLEDPSPENLRAYLDWRESRARKILRAAELLKEYRGALAAEPGAVRSSPESAAVPDTAGDASPDSPARRSSRLESQGADRPRPFKILYFRRQGCPHCDRQDAVLAEWLKGRPEGRLEMVEFGTRPELWQALAVRGTPSLFLEDGTVGRSRFLEGFSGPESLNAALLGCRGSGHRAPPTLEKEEPAK